MIVTTNKNFILNKRGKEIPINQSLVDTFATPRGGWSASFTIQGTLMTVKANNARNTFIKSKNLLNHNNINISEKDLWFSLNVQWMSRLEDRGLVVTKESLLEAIVSKEEEPVTDDYHHPRTWGSIEWESLAMSLNVDENFYAFDNFYARCEMTLMLLDPSRSSRVGCIDCYKTFSTHLKKLRTNPVYTLEGAKQWLFETHNAVNEKLGKPTINYETARKVNKWK